MPAVPTRHSHRFCSHLAPSVAVKSLSTELPGVKQVVRNSLYSIEINAGCLHQPRNYYDLPRLGSIPGATGDASSGSGAHMKTKLTSISAIGAEQSSRMFDEAGTTTAGTR